MSKRKVAASLRVGATAAVECASSRSNGYAAATLAPSKGRLMRCTVDGLTLNRSAMTRMPGRPGVARASRICFSSAGAIERLTKTLPLAPGPRKPGADAFLDHGALELGKHAHHLEHGLAPAGVVVSMPC